MQNRFDVAKAKFGFDTHSCAEVWGKFGLNLLTFGLRRKIFSTVLSNDEEEQPKKTNTKCCPITGSQEWSSDEHSDRTTRGIFTEEIVPLTVACFVANSDGVFFLAAKALQHLQPIFPKPFAEGLIPRRVSLQILKTFKDVSAKSCLSARVQRQKNHGQLGRERAGLSASQSDQYVIRVLSILSCHTCHVARRIFGQSSYVSPLPCTVSSPMHSVTVGSARTHVTVCV